MSLSPRARISQIDRQIDAVRKDLLSKATVNQLSSHSWQAAWDQFPELRRRERDLYRQRGEAQLERDIADSRAAAKAARSARLRTRKCPTCGVSSFAKVAA